MSENVFGHLNVNQLRIFESVYRLRSMTLAAQELFLTQSGVSQHIKSFEETLGLSLFVRNRSGLFATTEADELAKTCRKVFLELSETLTAIKNPQQQQLSGLIRLGVPTEFGNNIVIPLLAEWSKKNPQVKFDLIYGHRAYLVEQLKKTEIDLAFIDSIHQDKKLNSKVVYRENLHLVATMAYLKEKKIAFKSGQENIKQLLTMDFLDYEHQESILRMWFQYHYSKKNVGLNIKAWAMNVQGIASLIKQNMGAAVLPDHLTTIMNEEGAGLHLFKGKKSDLKNEISLAWLKDRPLSRATEDLKRELLSK